MEISRERFQKIRKLFNEKQTIQPKIPEFQDENQIERKFGYTS